MQKVAFVWLHGSAKSRIAAEHFNRLAPETSLPMRETTSGPESSSEVHADVVERMSLRGSDVKSYKPILITPEGLEDADLIVSRRALRVAGSRRAGVKSAGTSVRPSATTLKSPGSSSPAALTS